MKYATIFHLKTDIPKALKDKSIKHITLIDLHNEIPLLGADN